jgi:uncharacterized protein involved in exopolysaccharide biosynthesis
MEVLAILELLRRHIFLIVALCIVTMVAGYGISFFSPLIPEKYDAAATVLVRPHDQIRIEPSSSSKEFMDFPVAQSPVVEAASKTYIQIIQSPALIAEVVRELGLDHRPKKVVTPGNVFARIAASMKASLEEAAPYLKDALSIVKYGRVVEDDPFAKAVDTVGKGLALKAYEDTYVFEIRSTDVDPQIAADIANTTAKLFIQFMGNLRASEGKESSDRLETELSESRRHLVDARESLQKYKEANKTFLYEPEYDARLRIMSDLTVELAKLDATYANESAAAGTIEGNTYAKKREALLKDLAHSQTDLASLPTVERELQLRQADVDVANATYATVAKKLKDAEIKTDAMPDARLISPATPPQVPSRPRRDIIVLVSALAGLMVGAALAFFFEYINRKARGIKDIEDFVGLKVIGTIPNAARIAPAARTLEHFR